MSLAFVFAGLGQDIANAIVSAIGNAINFFFSNSNAVNFISAPIKPLLSLMITTDPNATYANAAVMSSWRAMLVVANAFLILMLMSGGLQMMVGQATATAYLPLRQLLPRFIAVGLAVNFSLLWGQVLIDIERGLCSAAQFDIAAFLASMGGTGGGGSLLLFAISIVFAFTFISLIFQFVERIVLIDLLLVLAPLWVLMFLLEQTRDYGKLGSRLLTLAILVQFLQIEAFALGAKFLASAALGNPLLHLILGAGMIFFIGHIPKALYRFGLSTAGGGHGSAIGTVIRTGLTAAALLA